MKIEGVPDGWELVRIGAIDIDEWTVDAAGNPQQYLGARHLGGYWPIIRRIEPHCTWQHGQFKDGWVTEDDGELQWFSSKPYHNGTVWDCSVGASFFELCMLVNVPVFRSSLPWNERIQQVGPTIEATLRGET